MNHNELQKQLMSQKRLKSLSKFLAVILRHKPHEFGLSLDEEGFAPLDEVWQVIKKKYGGRYFMRDLETVVAGDDSGKKRYEIRDNMIRAMYGHSLKNVIQYEAATPPDMLYHGTAIEILPKLRAEGLKAMSRQFVHLTTNTDIAGNVAGRHSRNTILLQIRARDAHDAGTVFHHAEEEHYLAKAIPPEFIVFPDEQD